MQNFKVVCVDMFQTLVDVNTRIPFIWKKILDKDYTEEKAYTYGSELVKEFIPNYYQKCQSETFELIRSMYTNSFEIIFNRYKLDLPPNEAAEILMKEHGFAKPYDDTEHFFKLIEDTPLCLVSDADFDMIGPILEKYNFDAVFISEELKAYKSSPENLMFKKVLEKYNVKPEEVIHIGDSYADIFGATQVGINTCWINRNGEEWTEEIKPDFTISSLEEIKKILYK